MSLFFPYPLRGIPGSWVVLVGTRSIFGGVFPCYHRKFGIVDGERAYVTGANLMHTYFGGRENNQSYDDFDVYTSDPCIVHGLVVLDTFHGLPGDIHNLSAPVRTDCFRVLQHLLQAAEKRCVLFTGLFEPDDETVDLIRSVLLRGVQCIIVKSDYRTLVNETSFYSEQILERLGADFRATPGNISHGKMWQVDDGPVWLGSCNLTHRSMTLDMEVMVRLDATDYTRSFDAILASTTPRPPGHWWQRLPIATGFNAMMDDLDRGTL
jgi:phosphatidylserine/phosphatidylglycerophosphate/cardiolipin synthase-like enzyme